MLENWNLEINYWFY